MDEPAQPHIRGFLASQNEGREAGAPGFRAPGDADPDGDDGDLLPMFIDPREGPPAPGEKKGTENNSTGILSLVYTGGVATGPLEKFHRRETYDIWIRTMTPQLAKHVADRLRLLLHDKRDWNMDGLQVIESMEWRPMQPVGHGPQGYSYTVTYLLELYSEGGL